MGEGWARWAGGERQNARPSSIKETIPALEGPCLPRKTPHLFTQSARLSFQMTEVQKGLNKQLLDGTLKVGCSSLSHLLTCFPCNHVS